MGTHIEQIDPFNDAALRAWYATVRASDVHGREEFATPWQLAETQAAHRAEQRDRVKAHQTLLDLMYTPDWLRTHHGPFNTVGDPHMPPHARRGHFLASKKHDSWHALPKITAPTLVVHGADDVFNPVANAPLLAERIPNSRVSLIPGARHAYFEEFRAVASPLVLDFLR